MIQITGPAVAIILVIGYLGVNAIANGINSLFKDKEHDSKNRD